MNKPTLNDAQDEPIGSHLRCYQPPPWEEILKRNGNANQPPPPPPVTPTRPLCISAIRVNLGNGQWFLRAVIDADINGSIIRSAVESPTAEDESTETVVSKLTEVIDRIPESIRYMSGQLTAKPAEEPDKEQA